MEHRHSPGDRFRPPRRLPARQRPPTSKASAAILPGLASAPRNRYVILAIAQRRLRIIRLPTEPRPTVPAPPGVEMGMVHLQALIPTRQSSIPMPTTTHLPRQDVAATTTA